MQVSKAVGMVVDMMEGSVATLCSRYLVMLFILESSSCSCSPMVKSFFTIRAAISSGLCTPARSAPFATGVAACLGLPFALLLLPRELGEGATPVCLLGSACTGDSQSPVSESAWLLLRNGSAPSSSCFEGVVMYVW